MPNAGKQAPGRGRNYATDMVRQIAFGIALLLLVSVPGRAAELCEKEHAAQQRGAHPPAAAKPDKPIDDKAHPEPRPKWWIDAKLRAELSINDQQSASVEKVWNAAAPGLSDLRAKLQKLEETLSQMTDSNADETAVIAQIAIVETTRAELNKGRTLMIYRMNKLLTADQRAKVKAMYDRREPNKRVPSLR
jgi:Spy/CpxP family protein refolding chaperone